ncbi:MAG: D-alanyl-D-alanine carboxypeptidase family protein [Clostridia bacterium]|nr:D-alanyl-D-alanine carboxypeptidase family protein [Clostridia bacterium]
MAKKRSSDAYGKLVRILIVLFVLALICGAGYMLLDQSIKAQEAENIAQAQQENAALEESYRQAKAEEAAQAAQQVEEIQWPTPKAEGWDVVDLSNYPLTNTRTYSATRQELITSGMLLVNRWHAVPDDLAACEFLGVHATDKSIATANSSVVMLSPAIDALGQMLAGAKADGLEHYNVLEGYRTRESQQKMFDKEAARYSDSLTGDNLTAKVVSAGVSAPGTSEYESGLAFNMSRYLKGDDIMNKKFHELPQSDWMVEHSWEYGIILRFPVQGYPNSTVTDKSYKTGQSTKLDIYRYVGKANAAVMHIMNFCMEEYIEYLIAHPHIAVYQDGALKYEIIRTEDYAGGDATVNVTRTAQNVSVSVDNMNGGGLGGLIIAMSY